MAGLNCGTPSLLAWEILKNQADIFLSVDDHYALKAMKKYYDPGTGDERIESGESGAAGLAGLLALLNHPGMKHARRSLGIHSKSKILLFNTEGITDPELFRKNTG